MTNPASMRRRVGFTLIETIVTIGLLAVLAAFVVPSVVQKASAADPVKIANDLNSIRTAMESYSNDTHAGFPNQLWILTTKPSTLNHLIDSVDATHTGTSLTVGIVNAWNGPYLSATIDTVAGVLQTGFNAQILNHLQRYDAVANKGEGSGGTAGAIFNVNSSLYVAIRINGLTTPQAELMNRIMDGPTDTDVSVGPDLGANQTGRFRFDKPNAANVVTAYFLAVPITQ
jgi:type II secretory pathway pseudopilin PulG